MAIALFVALAVALGVAVFRPGMIPGLSTPFAPSPTDQIHRVGDALKNLGTSVADILAGRSPGERATGVLASLKPKRRSVLHQRALPKIRGPVAPLAETVPPAAAPFAETAPQLYDLIGQAPARVVPAIAFAGGTPLSLPASAPLAGGGGGGVFLPPGGSAPPPAVSPLAPTNPPAVVTPLPGTPAVPEPRSWAMLLLGFAMIGGVARKRASYPIAAV